jgi:hypothetical protein
MCEQLQRIEKVLLGQYIDIANVILIDNPQRDVC